MAVATAAGVAGARAGARKLVSLQDQNPHPVAKNATRIDWIRAKARFDPVFFGLRIKDAGKKGAFDDDYRCDFHPSWQQVSWLDTETGETGEQKLVQAAGDAERFYRQVAAPALIGMEATGNCHWLGDLLADLRHELWVGDAAQIRASYVRQQKTDKRDAAHILKLLVEGRFPRIWIPSSEVPDLQQLLLHRYKLVTIRARVKNELQHLCLNQGVQRKHKLWSQAGQKVLLELPLKPWAARRREGLLALMAMLDSHSEWLDRAVIEKAQQDEMALLVQTQPGVGTITALAYLLAVGDVSAFPR